MTLVLALGVALFFASSLLYSVPVLMDPPPEGAPESYAADAVRAHLAGKVPYFFAGSLVAAALIVTRGGRR